MLAGVAAFAVLSVSTGHGPVDLGKPDTEQAEKRDQPSGGPMIRPPVQASNKPHEVPDEREPPPAPTESVQRPANSLLLMGVGR